MTIFNIIIFTVHYGRAKTIIEERAWEYANAFYQSGGIDMYAICQHNEKKKELVNE